MDVAKDILIEVIEANAVVAQRMQLCSRMPSPSVMHFNRCCGWVIHLAIIGANIYINKN